MARKDADKGQKLVAAMRRVRVLELRKIGLSYRAIAAQLTGEGYECSHETVRKDLKRSLQDCLSKIDREEIEDMKILEIERLNQLFLAHWSRGLNADIPSTWILIAILEFRARLLGLNVPKQLNVKIDTKEALSKLLGVNPDELPEPGSANGEAKTKSKRKAGSCL